jgi:hypothetical protein
MIDSIRESGRECYASSRLQYASLPHFFKGEDDLLSLTWHNALAVKVNLLYIDTSHQATGQCVQEPVIDILATEPS